MSTTEQRSRTSDPDQDEPDGFRGQAASIATGALFVVVGALGFIPGVTRHVPFKAGERFSGPESHVMLFGVFQTSVLANLIFLSLGVIGAVCGFFALTARLYFFGAAAIFAFLGIYGLCIDRSGPANFLPMNLADDVLHLALAVALVVVGLVTSVLRRR